MKQIINQIFTNFNHINIQKGHKIILHKHKIHQIINLLSVIIYNTKNKKLNGNFTVYSSTNARYPSSQTSPV